MTSLDGISNILAIRLSGIGDVILMMPALAELKRAFPKASLTLITGSQCVTIAELCPYIDNVVPVDRKALKNKPKLRAAREIYSLIRNVQTDDFDLVIDFHSLRETNLITWVSGAPQRLGLKRSERAYLSFCFNLEPAVQNNDLHMQDTFRALARGVPGLESSDDMNGPVIEIPSEAKAVATRLAVEGPVVALNVGASRAPRRWAAERFSTLASHAVDHLGASVLIIGGASPGEEAVAREVQNGAGNVERVHLANGLSFPEVAAAIDLVDLLVSNDSGPMHLGPALGVPTIGIFAGGSPRHYHPSGPLDQYVEGNSMDEIPVEAVVQVLDEVWAQIEGRRESLGKR